MSFQSHESKRLIQPRVSDPLDMKTNLDPRLRTKIERTSDSTRHHADGSNVDEVVGTRVSHSDDHACAVETLPTWRPAKSLHVDLWTAPRSDNEKKPACPLSSPGAAARQPLCLWLELEHHAAGRQRGQPLVAGPLLRPIRAITHANLPARGSVRTLSMALQLTSSC
jgi:hypothetical protein